MNKNNRYLLLILIGLLAVTFFPMASFALDAKNDEIDSADSYNPATYNVTTGNTSTSATNNYGAGYMDYDPNADNTTVDYGLNPEVASPGYGGYEDAYVPGQANGGGCSNGSGVQGSCMAVGFFGSCPDGFDRSWSPSGQNCASGSVCCIMEGGGGGANATDLGDERPWLNSGAGGAVPWIDPDTGETLYPGDGRYIGDSVGTPAGTGQGVVIPSTTGLPSTPIAGERGILTSLLLWLITVFGTLAIAAFIVSGIMYLLATGNEKMAEKAKSGMTYSLIGVVVALSAVVIIRAIDAALRGVSFF